MTQGSCERQCPIIAECSLPSNAQGVPQPYCSMYQKQAGCMLLGCGLQSFKQYFHSIGLPGHGTLGMAPI